MTLSLAPCTITDARKFVGQHHRHNLPPLSAYFAVRVVNDDGTTVGVGIVGHPTARGLQDGYTCEAVRVCTDGAENACSMLYGAVARAAKALGYRRVVTYTLASEPGTSLKAAGWKREAELPARNGWLTPSDPGRGQPNLFGKERAPTGAKVRWVRRLGA